MVILEYLKLWYTSSCTYSKDFMGGGIKTKIPLSESCRYMNLFYVHAAGLIRTEKWIRKAKSKDANQYIL
jgi:hypothetical protein